MTTKSEEISIFRSAISKFVDAEILPHVDEWEDNHWFPSEIFQTLGREGFLGILIPEELGGIDGDLQLATAWSEEFGRIPSVGFTTAVNMHSLVIAPTLARMGTEEIKEQWIPKCLSGEAIGAYAFTEPGAGSDLSQIKTKATRTGDSWTINGNKIFITNGARANFVIVVARTSDSEDARQSLSSFVVDTSLPGFSVTKKLDKLGWHASDTAELSFENVEVPHSALLGEEGQGWTQSMNSLNWERLMLSFQALGGSKECIKATKKYMDERVVFGKKLNELSGLQNELVELSARLMGVEAVLHAALRKMTQQAECRREVSLGKLLISDLGVEIADRCLQYHGGYGYTTEFRPERWLRDLRLNAIGGGTSEIMKLSAAKFSLG